MHHEKYDPFSIKKMSVTVYVYTEKLWKAISKILTYPWGEGYQGDFLLFAPVNIRTVLDTYLLTKGRKTLKTHNIEFSFQLTDISERKKCLIPNA